jgi:hypothetical protein
MASKTIQIVVNEFQGTLQGVSKQSVCDRRAPGRVIRLSSGLQRVKIMAPVQSGCGLLLEPMQ